MHTPANIIATLNPKLTDTINPRVKRDQPYIDAMLERLKEFHNTWMGMKGKKPPRKKKVKVEHDFI